MRIVTSGLPMMDTSAITTFVDQWRSEIHTFQLTCGEVTIKLEDVTMILGLLVDILDVSGLIQLAG